MKNKYKLATDKIMGDMIEISAKNINSMYYSCIDPLLDERTHKADKLGRMMPIKRNRKKNNP